MPVKNMRTYNLWLVLLLLPVSACRTSRQAETAAFREQVWGDSAGGHEACSLQFSQRMEAVRQQLSGLSVRVVEYGRFDSVIAPKKITEIRSVAAENKRMHRAGTVRRVAEKETSLKRARKETVGETSVEKKKNVPSLRWPWILALLLLFTFFFRRFDGK